jgi:hypothetical protein
MANSLESGEGRLNRQPRPQPPEVAPQPQAAVVRQQAAQRQVEPQRLLVVALGVVHQQRRQAVVADEADSVVVDEAEVADLVVAVSAAVSAVHKRCR